MQISYQYYKNPKASNTLLLVHGYCSDHRVWDRLLVTLKPHYSVLTLDLPGYYLNEHLDSYYSIEDFAKTIVELLEHLNLDKVTYVGHSMGGYVGLEVLSKYPQYLEALVMLNSHCYRDSFEKATNRSKTIQFLERRGSDIYINEIYKSLFGNDFYTNNLETIQELKSNAKEYPVKTLIHSCEAMIAREDHSVTIIESHIPIYFLMGDRDALIPIEEYIDMLTLSPLETYQILTECGHMGMYEATEDVSDFLINNL